MKHSNISEIEIRKALAKYDQNAALAYYYLTKKYGNSDGLGNRIVEIIDYDCKNKNIKPNAKSKNDVRIKPGMINYFRVIQDNGDYFIETAIFNEIGGINKYREKVSKDTVDERLQELANDSLENMREYCGISSTKFCSKDAETLDRWQNYVNIYDGIQKNIPEDKFNELASNEYDKPSYGIISDDDSTYYGIFSPKMIGHINILRTVSDYAFDTTEIEDFNSRLNAFEVFAEKNTKRNIKEKKLVKKQR